MTRCLTLATGCYSIEETTRKYIKGYGLMSIARNLSSKYKKQLYKINTWKTASTTKLENCFHKAAEAADQFIGNEFADKIVKPKPLINENSRNVGESYSIREKTRNIKKIQTSIIKYDIIKYLSYWTIQLYQNCEAKTSNWWKFKKCWRKLFHQRKDTKY